MSSTSVISIIVVILAVSLIDVFCGDVTNTRQTRPWQNNQNSNQTSPDIILDGKSTTPWPTLGRRPTSNPNLDRNTPTSGRSPTQTTSNPNLSRNTPTPSRNLTQSSRKWIQQNNIWIRNEQASAGGEVAPQNTNHNLGDNRQNLRGQQQNSGVLQTNVNTQIHQTNRQQALIDGLRGSQQSLGNNKGNVGSSGSNNRGDIRTNVNSQTNQGNKQQQALINGLRGNQQNPGNPSAPNQNASEKPLSPLSGSGGAPNKPTSYAGAVGPNNPFQSSPGTPKTPVSLPLSPQKGGPKKDAIISTGPTKNNENVNDDENIKVSEGEATDEELREFSEMLLRKDSNNAMKYVTLNIQGMTSSRSANDEAPQPLLKIDQEAYKIPSVEKMMLLYNNYFLDAGQNEVYTGTERIEENNLLDTVLATPVMQYARSFLVQKGKIGKDPKEFKDLLRLIWFNMYSRGQGRIGSSGFEHIFLAEIKNNQVSGLHNWLYFNEEESQQRANYLGYLKKVDLGEKGAILKYHFTFHDIDKPVGSMFIGTSPELELALYSTCFVLRADKICPLKMNGNKFIIRTYTFRYRGKNMIGSAFPEI